MHLLCSFAGHWAPLHTEAAKDLWPESLELKELRERLVDQAWQELKDYYGIDRPRNSNKFRDSACDPTDL